MTKNFKIRTQRTIVFRTDCFSENSQKSYHLRATRKPMTYGNSLNIGYEKVIDDCVTEQDVHYEVGHNPKNPLLGVSQTENPIICDKLILNGYFEGCDLYYDSLIFERPALTASSHVYDRTGTIDVRGNTFFLIDSMFADARSGLNISGQFYTGSGYTPQTRNRLATPFYRSYWASNYRYKSGDYFKISPAFTYARSLMYSGLSQYIFSFSELLSKIKFFGSYQEIEKVFSEIFNYGAVIIPYDEIDCLLFRNNTVCPYFPKPPYDGESWYNIFIVPFISYDEYYAAKAALYRWEDSVIEKLHDLGL